MHCPSGFILLAGLPLILHVAQLPLFFTLAYISYALPIWPHSPSWPLLLCVARLTSLPLTYVRMCARHTVLGITGLHLVRVVRLASFFSLNFILYTLLVLPHSSH